MGRHMLANLKMTMQYFNKAHPPLPPPCPPPPPPLPPHTTLLREGLNKSKNHELNSQ